ncbi:2400_t:CDS:2 [Funneliformis geosporum]|nr:2400_t:CDS:2 [Funneliformis geosporum]
MISWIPDGWKQKSISDGGGDIIRKNPVIIIEYSIFNDSDDDNNDDLDDSDLDSIEGSSIESYSSSAEISTTKPTQSPVKSHCTYINLPNYPMANQRKKCIVKLTKTVHTIDRALYRPSLIYPMVNLKYQLQLIYNRKGFEESYRK